MVTNELDRIAQALGWLNADDRDVWWRMGAAIYDHMGEVGHDTWVEWSIQSPRFKRQDAEAVWRSFKTGAPGGRNITIGSLFGAAKAAGWTPGEAGEYRPDPEELRAAAERRAKEQAIREAEAKRAAAIAAKWVRFAEPASHPYLEAKGFPNHKGLVLNGLLLIPIRNQYTGKIQAVQTIGAIGEKKYQPKGCIVQEGVHYIGGRGERWWWCEGYATGLSIYEALRKMYRERDRVVVAFSSGGIAAMADRGTVIADHDLYSCPLVGCKHRWVAEWGTVKACPMCGGVGVTEPAGEKAARQSGLRWWMPVEAETDANDQYLAHGVESLAYELRRVLAHV